MRFKLVGLVANGALFILCQVDDNALVFKYIVAWSMNLFLNRLETMQARGTLAQASIGQKK